MKTFFVALATIAIAVSAQAKTFPIDTKESTIAWKASKKLGDSHNGHVAVKEGNIETDKKGTVTGGHFSADMKTISNEDLKAKPDYQKKLVDHLSSNDFFDVEKFPTAEFKITSITKKDGNNYQVKGDFTMIGKTNPIEFPVSIMDEKTQLVGTGKITIDRTKWGLKYGSGNFFKELADSKIIKNEFELDVRLIAKKDNTAKK